MELSLQSAHSLHQQLRTGQVSSREIVESVFRRMDQWEDRINAYVTVMRSSALRQAERADGLIRSGDMGPLMGIPMGVKDNICLKGVPTTCGSRLLKRFHAPYHATVVERLKQAGAVFLGKTNLDEFAMGSSTESSHFGPTRNPWHTEHVCGGSSGGSAAATVTGECVASLGSDTGGSIRLPASHCGVVGLKPTYGRVSRYGLVAFASSLEQVGPLTRDVRDCALVLGAISGRDPRDATSASEDVPDYTAGLEQGVKGFRIGVPRQYMEGGLDADVKQTVLSAMAQLESLGADIEEVSLPHTPYGVAAYYIIAPAEASSNLSRYDGVQYGIREEGQSIQEMTANTRIRGFGAEVIRRIMLGTYVLSAGYYDAYYRKASQVRTLVIRDFEDAFRRCDALLAPVAPAPAFRLKEKTDDPLAMYLTDVFTVSANLSGIPSISVPCGRSKTGLPIGVQVLGDHFDERRLLRIAYALEQCRGNGNPGPSIPVSGPDQPAETRAGG